MARQKLRRDCGGKGEGVPAWRNTYRNNKDATGIARSKRPMGHVYFEISKGAVGCMVLYVCTVRRGQRVVLASSHHHRYFRYAFTVTDYGNGPSLTYVR